MSQPSKIFISFSERDQLKVRRLFAALEIQNVSLWNYSDPGQELGLAKELRPSLKAKIDDCEYFIAIISPNSIDEKLAAAPRFEVRYAIESGKLRGNRLLPVLLDNPSEEWLSLYEALGPVVRNTFDYDSEERFEESIRKICDWLAVSYTPSSLKDPRVFFARLFLEEIEDKQLDNSVFVHLLHIMNSAASKLLVEDWGGVKEKTILFLNLAKQKVSQIAFQYPLVIKGVCELQLGEFENARRTFLEATTADVFDRPTLLGLGYAGLGHTFFLLQDFDKSLRAFKQAIDLQPNDQPDEYLQCNYLGALVSAGGMVLDETALDGFDGSKLSPEDRLKLLTLKAALDFKKGNYLGVISTFSGLAWNNLDEASAIYYSMALQAIAEEERAILMLRSVAARTKSADLYHHLANIYLLLGRMSEALSIYKDVLFAVTEPTDFARQILIEYAQLVRAIEGKNQNFQEACERAVNPEVFPPPQSHADCFFAGFAYHLLGKSDFAKLYYGMAGNFSAQYYDEIELTTNRAHPSSIKA